MITCINYVQHILPLYQKKSYLKTQRNRYYSIAYLSNYSPQVRQIAREKYKKLDKDIEEINNEIKWLNDRKGLLIDYEPKNF